MTRILDPRSSVVLYYVSPSRGGWEVYSATGDGLWWSSSRDYAELWAEMQARLDLLAELPA